MNPPFGTDLHRLTSSLAEEPAVGPTSTTATPVERLDFAAAVKVSQAISGAIVLEELIDALMRIAVELAEAERGLLILPRGAEQRIAAEAATSGGSVIAHLRDERIGPAALPESVLRHVLRTGETVFLDDAVAQSAFGDDPYIRERRIRSILCLPLINQGKLNGVLVLENLNRSVSVSARTTLLKFLAAQAAISLDNAALYSRLRSQAYLAEPERLGPAGSFGLSAASGKVVLSDEMFRIFGYDKACPVTLEMALQRVHPQDLARALGAVQRLSQDRNDCADDYRLLMPDGSIKYVYIVVGAANDAPGGFDFMGAVVDVTAAKQAIQELQESEQQFRDYAETASDWYWETDADHRFMRMKDYEQLRAMGRLPLTSRIGLTRWDFAKDVESQPEKWEHHRSILEARQPFRDFVYPAVRFDGSFMYVKISGKPVYDAEGGFLGYRGTGSDVTASVRADQAEAALRQARAELVHISRVSTLGELAASIAHEVNQPIAGTLLNAQTALRWLGAETPNLIMVGRALDRIVRDSIRAGAVVGRVRALIKKAPSRDDRVDINAAIREVIELTRSEASKNGVSVRMELAENLPPVRGDRVELQQVVINLVLNAVEAMGGLTEGPRELQIVTSKTESDQALIAVRDTGPGLAPAARENLFKAFHTTKPNGLGLGLSICRSIVESRGGRMWASANAPRGAAFHFTLPVPPEIAA